MLRIKVTNCGLFYGCRLFDGLTLISEYRCENKLDIGKTCREMLRWQAKMGSTDPLVLSSRERLSKDCEEPVGKIWKHL